MRLLLSSLFSFFSGLFTSILTNCLLHFRLGHLTWEIFIYKIRERLTRRTKANIRAQEDSCRAHLADFSWKSQPQCSPETFLKVSTNEWLPNTYSAPNDASLRRLAFPPCSPQAYRQPLGRPQGKRNPPTLSEGGRNFICEPSRLSFHPWNLACVVLGKALLETSILVQPGRSFR